MLNRITPVFVLVTFTAAPQQTITLNAPPPPSVSVISATASSSGTGTYCYWIVAQYPIGAAAPSEPYCISKASGAITVHWQAKPHATSYDVLRTTSSSLPSVPANIAVAIGVRGTTQVDTLGAADSYTIKSAGPAAAEITLDNLTGSTPQVKIFGSVIIQGDLVVGTTMLPASVPVSIIAFNTVAHPVDPTGVADSAAGIQAAVSAASAGATVLFPLGTYRIATTVVDAGKAITFAGMGEGSVITGTGTTLLKLTANNSGVSRLKILASDPSRSTVGLELSNGTNGIGNWRISDCHIVGQNSVGGSGGVGVLGTFALKGTMDNNVIEAWGDAIRFVSLDAGHKPNANKLFGNKIRISTVGLHIAGSVDDIYLSGNTFEGNGTGLQSDGAVGQGTYVSAVMNHFEQNLGLQTNVNLTDTAFYSVFNFYGAGSTFKDIVVNKSLNFAGPIVSIGDYFANGVTHNGTGPMSVTNFVPARTLPRTGTGPITFHQDGWGELPVRHL